MNRRTFIKLSAIGAVSLLTGCKTKEILPASLDVKFLRQIVTKDISTSRCVMWQVDEPMKNPAVEVKTGDDSKIFPAQNSTFTDDGKQIIQYTAQIETGDEYRIVDGEATGDWHALKTSGDKFTAIIFPDSQCGDSYDTWGQVARAAFERNPDAAFFLNVGDIVDNGEDSAQWEDWFAQIEHFLPEIPFAPVMGNHETYSREWTVRPPVAYLNYFAPPDNGVEKFSRRFYSFDYGAAHFVILDSQWDELGTDIIDAQKSWLREDLAKTLKPWKIAFISHAVRPLALAMGI